MIQRLITRSHLLRCSGLQAKVCARKKRNAISAFMSSIPARRTASVSHCSSGGHQRTSARTQHSQPTSRIKWLGTTGSCDTEKRTRVEANDASGDVRMQGFAGTRGKRFYILKNDAVLKNSCTPAKKNHQHPPHRTNNGDDPCCVSQVSTVPGSSQVLSHLRFFSKA